MPSGYKPPEVGIAAMLHTKPKLTWDGEDEGRKRMLHKRISKEELRDDDFKVVQTPLRGVCLLPLTTCVRMAAMNITKGLPSQLFRILHITEVKQLSQSGSANSAVWMGAILKIKA